MKQNIRYNSYYLKRQQLLFTMAEELPEKFDIIVLGTGLEESLLAAACARNGHHVLHLDPSDYYGGEWGAFTLEGIEDWFKTHSHLSEEESRAFDTSKFHACLKEGEKIVPLNKDFNRFFDVKREWYCPREEKRDSVLKQDIKDLVVKNEDEVKGLTDISEEQKVRECQPEGENENDKSTEETCDNTVNSNISSKSNELKTWTKEYLFANNRCFNIDLTSKLLYTSGSMVNLLISSNVSRYVEFKAVSRVLTTTPDGKKLDHVPSSRADVFSTERISVVEKRILMKFLTFALNYDACPEVYSDFTDKPFADFLKHEKLTPNLTHFLLNSIALVEKDKSTLEGLRSTQKFLSSLGKFGSNTTPFLWTVFGGGEMPQAFCRLCAVFGGTYYLGRTVEGLIINGSGKVEAVLVDNGTKRIACNTFIANEGYLPKDLKNFEGQEDDNFYRSISIVNSSVMPTETEQISAISVPETYDGCKSSFAFIQEVGHGTATCPKGLYLRHRTSRSPKPLKGLQFEDASSILWTLSFGVKSGQPKASFKSKLHDNLYYTSGPVFELDYDETIKSARKIYHDIFPDEEFLPRAPDPEEIIIGEEGETADASKVEEKDPEALSDD